MNRQDQLGPRLFKSLSIVCFSAAILSSCASPLKHRLPAGTKVEGYLMVNEENPGESIDIKRSLVRGKYTIIEFTSPFCGPCQQVKPYLHKLNDSRPDVVVRAFDINRKGIEGIDWESPLAMKYGVSSVPRYQIYNERGAKISDGHDASNEVTDMINKSLNPRSAGE